MKTSLYRSLGKLDQAVQCHKKSLSILKEVGDKAGEGRSYGNLGNVYYSLGDFQQAIEYHEKHLSIAKEIGDSPQKEVPIVILVVIMFHSVTLPKP